MSRETKPEKGTSFCPAARLFVYPGPGKLENGQIASRGGDLHWVLTDEQWVSFAASYSKRGSCLYSRLGGSLFQDTQSGEYISLVTID
jgi:hypothetical protein